MNKVLSEPMRPVALGKHLIADFYSANNLYDANTAAPVMRKAAEAAGATVLDVKLHHFGDKCGFTGVVLLAESHISIHTWPENDYAAIDIFMCGDAEPEKSLDILRKYFQPAQEQVQLIARGTQAALAKA